MPFFTAIAMYDTNHDNLFTDLFGPFQTYEIAETEANLYINQEKQNYINDYGDEEYVEYNFSFVFTIKEM